MSTSNSFVVEVGDGFLGFNGKTIVKEFPDAHQFPNKKAAQMAAKRAMTEFVKVAVVEGERNS